MNARSLLQSMCIMALLNTAVWCHLAKFLFCLRNETQSKVLVA